MSSTTKPFEEKMNASVNHLVHELASIRAGRANPAILDKITVDYYGTPTPINQVAAIAVSEARHGVVLADLSGSTSLDELLVSSAATPLATKG